MVTSITPADCPGWRTDGASRSTRIRSSCQESLINVMLQHEIVWRPPAYYTCDWAAARRSVETIAALDPEVLATGHGHPMRGALMRLELRNFVEDFDDVMPMSGRYIPFPAVTDHSGVVHVPPRVGVSPAQIGIATAIGAAGIGLAWYARARLKGARYGSLRALP